MNNSRFPILFATDKGYVPHLATALYSLLRNNRDINARIVIFTGGISGEDQEKLRTIAGGFGAPLEFFNLNDSFFDGLVLNHHFKKSNYYRLFAADLIKGKSCLYLDADIIVTGSIKEIIEANLDSYYVAAVENPGFYRHEELGMNPVSKYFNSGVMLLNLDKWRQAGVKNKVIALTKEKPGSIRFVDQCGLNGVVDGRWLELDPRFNCQSYMLTKDSQFRCDENKKPVVIHFTGSGKPWHMNNKHPYKKLYWKYRNKTPYRSFFPDDFSFNTLIRYVTPQFAKDLVKKAIGKSSQ
jgi:lipopolysaccharide biosynthesis glycosyltransferase